MNFNLDEFRLIFPEFNDVDDVVVSFQFAIGQNYLTNFTEENQYKIYLMIAHLLYIRKLLEQGEQATIVTSANEGDVTIALAQPPRSTNFSYWLNVSSYGLQLLSVLEIEAMGGFFIGGSPEQSTIRRYNGQV